MVSNLVKEVLEYIMWHCISTNWGYAAHVFVYKHMKFVCSTDVQQIPTFWMGDERRTEQNRTKLQIAMAKVINV